MANFRPPTHPLLSTWLLNAPLSEINGNEFFGERIVVQPIYRAAALAESASGPPRVNGSNSAESQGKVINSNKKNIDYNK